MAAIVERLDLRLPPGAAAIAGNGFLLLHLGGIAEHDRRQGTCGGGAVDGAGETLLEQVGQVAAVVEVSVTENDGVKVFGSEREVGVEANAVAAVALDQSTVQQHGAAVRLDEVHRAGDAPRGAEEGDARLGGRLPLLTIP